MRKFGLILALSFTFHLSLAQEKSVNYGQIWLDFMTLYPFNNGIIYSANLGPRFLLNQENGWKSFEWNNSFFYNIVGPWLDVGAGLYIDYTIESNAYGVESFELRPWAAFRLDFFRNTKFWLLINNRIEQRNMFYSGDNPNSTSYRYRIRPELTYSINKPNFWNDRLFYFTLNTELYYPTRTSPEERFANLFVIRAGIGYRHTYSWRYHFVFQEQFAKNTINDEFQSSSVILNFRLLYFIENKNGRRE